MLRSTGAARGRIAAGTTCTQDLEKGILAMRRIRSLTVIAALSCGLSACFAATPPKETIVQSVPSTPAANAAPDIDALLRPCDVAKAQPFIGRLPDTATIDAVRRAAGASIVRIAAAPGVPMSMEGRAGRLTVTLGPDGRMALFACE